MPSTLARRTEHTLEGLPLHVVLITTNKLLQKSTTMASAQVHQQTVAATEQAKNEQLQPGPDALQQEEKVEPDCVPHHSAPQNNHQAPTQPSESGQVEKQVDVQHPGAKCQVPEEQVQSTGNKEQDVAAASPATSKLAESAQLRAQRLAFEAAEAQEVAQQAAKLAAEKQSKALAAAKEAEAEIHAEREAAKAAALHAIEEVAGRASKQQKLSPEASRETFRDLSQTTAEESLCPAPEQEDIAPHQSNQSSNGTAVPDGDSFKSSTQQFEPETTETVQQMDTTVDKPAEEISSPHHEQQGSQDVEQPTDEAQDADVPPTPGTLAQSDPQNSPPALASVPIQPPASVNGIQGHSVDPALVVTQEPYVSTPILPMSGLQHDSTTEMVGKAPEDGTCRTTPENQPTEEQGPTPMQVG